MRKLTFIGSHNCITIGSTADFKNTYSYNAINRLIDIVQQSQSGGNAVTAKHVKIGYNGNHQQALIERFQSTGTSSSVAVTMFSFDTLNRLSNLEHKQGGTVLAEYDYAYDGLSRFTSIDSSLEGLSSFEYDASRQLTDADHASQTDEAYTYNANGSRSMTGYTTSTNNRTTAMPGFTFSYDDEGNRTRKTQTSNGHVQEYEWDHRNRLTSVKFRNSVGGSITKQVDYEYDAFNRLVKRTYDADGAGGGSATNQYWVYDEGINAVLQFDGNAASNLSHRYIWSDKVDQLLADEQVTSLGSGGNVLWALSDHLGTIRDIADFDESTGITAIANHRKYNAFGALISETNSAVDLIYGFTGKQLDEATYLQHNLNRWYDSALGQWLSEDPIGFAAGDENLRRYVSNFAIERADVLGLEESNPYGEGYKDTGSIMFGYQGGGPIMGIEYLTREWKFNANYDGSNPTFNYQDLEGDWTFSQGYNGANPTMGVSYSDEGFGVDWNYDGSGMNIGMEYLQENTTVNLSYSGAGLGYDVNYTDGPWTFSSAYRGADNEYAIAFDGKAIDFEFGYNGAQPYGEFNYSDESSTYMLGYIGTDLHYRYTYSGDHGGYYVGYAGANPIMGVSYQIDNWKFDVNYKGADWDFIFQYTNRLGK